MNEKIKKYIGYAVVVALLAVSYSAIQASGAYKKAAEPSSFRSFAVSGEGKVVTVPDVATFNFTVLTKGGTDLSVIQKENADKMNKAIDFVKSKGVDKKDIVTESYNLSPEYETYNCYNPVPISPYEANQPKVTTVKPCPPPKIVGYTIRQAVIVKARDFSKVGELLSGVVSSGANEVSNLIFTVDDPKKIEAEAREKAITEAKEKAKALARASGFSIGRLLSINEGGSYPPYYYTKSAVMAEDAMGRGGAAPAIEPGSQEVKIQVTLSYEIE